jgi:hypothetical protein
VEGTAFDLREPKVMKDAFPKTPSDGYDNNFCIIQPIKFGGSSNHQLNFVAMLDAFVSLQQYFDANFAYFFQGYSSKKRQSLGSFL